jgi:3,4-dihydroxy 2-butanone 4-phosphate synthase / GTP cyclohydrolase II
MPTLRRLEVVDQVPIVGPIHEHNAKYIAAKRGKMRHKLP